MGSHKETPKDEPRRDGDALEEAKRIMKRLTEMPHKPHEPIGKRDKGLAVKATASKNGGGHRPKKT